MKAFEAAARLGGFGQAAAELNVMPGAVSRQIKLLEQWAGASRASQPEAAYRN